MVDCHLDVASDTLQIIMCEVYNGEHGFTTKMNVILMQKKYCSAAE